MINGSLKSLGSFWTNLALNPRYSAYVDFGDLLLFERRLNNEGSTFLTSVLPNIGKAVDVFHSTSEWIPPVGFHLKTVVQTDPAHLSYCMIFDVPIFLEKAVFASLKGDSKAVDCVRQLTLAFYKLEVDYGADKDEQFLVNFRKIDHDLLSVFDSCDNIRDAITEQMGNIIRRVLCNSNPLDITPSHGSGATACRTPNWKKHHRALHFYEKLDDVYPYSDYFFYNYTHLSDEYERLRDSQPQSVPRARVCLVPKDSRGPRVISCEPAEMMFIQQGLMRLLYRTIETHRLTSGRVNFTDQTVNRELARLSSKGEIAFATIDLSDASDRVSLELVRRVFPPNWFEALNACRSEETVLPNGEIVKLNKFAPMGSSCCFPVEALVFWACAQASLRVLEGVRQTLDVYVYGDDIVMPSRYAASVIRGLELIGLSVNVNKSYCQGPFRESCGGDFHFGEDVTPVRVRKLFGKSRTSIATNADLCNSLVAKFGYNDALPLIRVIEEEGGYVFPRSELQLPGVIRTAPCASNDVFFRRRYNRSLQRFEYRILRCTSVAKLKQPPNWEELFRKELSKNRWSSNTSINLEPGHYENPVAKLDALADPGWYTDPHSVVTKWVWTWLG